MHVPVSSETETKLLKNMKKISDKKNIYPNSRSDYVTNKTFITVTFFLVDFSHVEIFSCFKKHSGI